MHVGVEKAWKAAPLLLQVQPLLQVIFNSNHLYFQVQLYNLPDQTLLLMVKALYNIEKK